MNIIWLSGKCGCGKTKLVDEIIRDFEGANRKALKLNGNDFVNFLLKEIKEHRSNDGAVNYCRNSDLLAVDDADYALIDKPHTQRVVKEVIQKITENYRTRVILVTQKRAGKLRNLKFNSNQCGYFRLKLPSSGSKRELVEKWLKQDNLIIPPEKIKEITEKSDNLFQLKGLFNRETFKNYKLTKI